MTWSALIGTTVGTSSPSALAVLRLTETGTGPAIRHPRRSRQIWRFDAHAARNASRLSATPPLGPGARAHNLIIQRLGCADEAAGRSRARKRHHGKGTTVRASLLIEHAEKTGGANKGPALLSVNHPINVAVIDVAVYPKTSTCFSISGRQEPAHPS